MENNILEAEVNQLVKCTAFYGSRKFIAVSTIAPEKDPIRNLMNPYHTVTLFSLLNLICSFHLRSRSSSGSIVSDYGLDDRGSIPDRGRGFFF
jgi:hypothetical protein